MLTLRTAILTPLSGVLRVVNPTRKSKEENHEASCEDQEALCRSVIAANYQGPLDYKAIPGFGSGESLVRPEIIEVERMIEERSFDVLIAEDGSRLYRRAAQFMQLCERCEDSSIRLITVHDHIDTADPNWRLNSLFASMHHEMSNRDTSERIRRALRARFARGQLIQFTIWGYEKPPGAKSDEDLRRIPEAEAIYDRWFTILEEGGTYSEVSDFLNEAEIPTGKHCRSKFWTPKMVARLTHNPILKGLRQRNRKISRRINSTGRKKSVKAPTEELLERWCPHLAFIEPERYDRVIGLLSERNARFARGRKSGRDCRATVPKKRSRYPGRHLYCGICGGMLVYGAHGVKDSLVCTNAREYRCWNSVSVQAHLAREMIAAAIGKELASMPDFNDEMRAAMDVELRLQNADATRREQAYKRQVSELERNEQNLKSLMRAAGDAPIVLEEIKRLQVDRVQLERVRLDIERLRKTEVRLPHLDDIRASLKTTLAAVLAGTAEAARQLFRMIPSITVRPCQLVDGGSVRLRGEFVLDLAAGWDTGLVCSEHLTRRITVDLFEPPQREKLRSEVVRFRNEGLTEKQVSERLGLTVTAAQNAAALQRRMDELGVTDAYRWVTAENLDETRLTRHQHPRFRPLTDEQMNPPSAPAVDSGLST